MRLLAITLTLLTALQLSSCVEVAAMAVMLEQEEKETPDLPAPIMVDGPKGRHAIAQSSRGLSAAVIDPYTGKAVSVHGKVPGTLLRSEGKRYYIPKISKYPTAQKVPGTRHTYINPYDKRQVSFFHSKPGALVSSPTAGTFFYLAAQ
ncbi:hypothetical protein [Rubritalea marina]|uniref:hypothetical protein n=1 Tax=Rubritalea marina TaxID=361055 RepID=UPI000360FB66|nr:hypothetical protein [Rubritalea marina]